MNDAIYKRIETKTGVNLVDILSTQLTGSELNSLLMEVFAKRAKQLTANDLLRGYEKNRFVKPSENNPILLLEKSLDTLKCFNAFGFRAVQLSPLVPLGTCSVVGAVSQDKIVSALRNCEVLADATNALALEISMQKKHNLVSSDETLKYAATPRHVRAQPIAVKGFTPHFSIGCLVSSGVDTGNFAFEKSAVLEHIQALQAVLRNVFAVHNIYVKLQKRSGYAQEHFISAVHDHLARHLENTDVRLDSSSKENQYYQGLQFKVVCRLQGRELEIADGGFVDWTQKLLNNKKERYCISGFGLELLNRIEEGFL
jgi:hypothetical protein